MKKSGQSKVPRRKFLTTIGKLAATSAVATVPFASSAKELWAAKSQR